MEILIQPMSVVKGSCNFNPSDCPFNGSAGCTLTCTYLK